MWSPKKRAMQLNENMKEVGRTYGYCPRGRRWAVYLYKTYRQGDASSDTFTIGDKVAEYGTMEEARGEVFRLNGWNGQERRTQ